MKRFFILTFAVIFIAISFFFYKTAPSIDAHFDCDSNGYNRIALNFSTTGKLIDPTRPNEIPVQTLGYPFFIGIIYNLFGYNPTYVIISQIILCFVIACLLYISAARLFNFSTGIIVLGLLSVHLGFLIFSQFILTEILLITLFSFWLERWTLFITQKNLSAHFSSAFFLGLSMLVKPALMFFIPFMSIWTFIVDKPLIKKIFFLLLWFCIFFVPVIFYMSYNKALYNTFTVSPLMYENIYYYFSGKVISQIQNIPYKNALDTIEQLMEGKNHNDQSRWNRPKFLFNKLLSNYPLTVVLLWIGNMIKTIFGSYTTQLKILINPTLKGTALSFTETKGPLSNRLYTYATQGIAASHIRIICLCEIILMFLRYIFAVFGLLTMIKEKRYSLTLFIISLCSYLISITGHDGCARYRMPIEPFLLLLAAYGIFQSYQRIKDKAFSIIFSQKVA